MAGFVPAPAPGEPLELPLPLTHDVTSDHPGMLAEAPVEGVAEPPGEPGMGIRLMFHHESLSPTSSNEGGAAASHLRSSPSAEA